MLFARWTDWIGETRVGTYLSDRLNEQRALCPILPETTRRNKFVAAAFVLANSPPEARSQPKSSRGSFALVFCLRRAQKGQVPGIGAKTIEKIDEFLKTGKMQTLVGRGMRVEPPVPRTTTPHGLQNCRGVRLLRLCCSVSCLERHHRRAFLLFLSFQSSSGRLLCGRSLLAGAL